MAEINVERKRSSAGAAAVAALILVVLAVWWMMRSDALPDVIAVGSDSVAGETATVGGTVVDGTLPAPVEAYLAWNDEMRADSATRLDHQYTVTGIRNLAAALEALARPEEAGNVGAELRALRSRADTLQQNPASTQHADRARTMFRSLAGTMSAMQQARFPELAADVQAVGRAAESIRADARLLDQRAEVSDFFGRAAVAVRGMAGRR